MLSQTFPLFDQMSWKLVVHIVEKTIDCGEFVFLASVQSFHNCFIGLFSFLLLIWGIPEVYLLEELVEPFDGVILFFPESSLILRSVQS